MLNNGRPDTTNKFLSEHPGSRDLDTVARWNALFQYACQVEIAFFEQGLDAALDSEVGTSSGATHTLWRGKQCPVAQKDHTIQP